MLQNDSRRDNTITESSTGRNEATAAAVTDMLPPLQDRFGRTFDYVRIAVTEKCNLRCTYCMPEEGVDLTHKDNVLTSPEILRSIAVLARMGVRKVRFTGGEPLVRKDIVELVAGAASTPGVKAVHLTTNGILFEKYAKGLREAGLTGVNISLDTMDPDRFVEITRRTGHDTVLRSIDLAIELGFPRVKINVVLMRGLNEDELYAFTELARNKRVTVRFIEFMPFDGQQIWESGVHFASAESLVHQIEDLYPGIQPAPGTRTEHHTFQAEGHAGKIAVIPAFTRSLCGNCSRIRLTSDGSIRNCLYSDLEYNLREPMRAGCSDDDVVALFRQAFAEKAKDGFESAPNN
ncbi:MAG: Molybdenum cofactor biosynthesis protein A [Halothiobacillaceae bacterium]|nr:MAG: Molybdenum cofactor biosynthesis protein A [Halothiobacillaceae bacterium]